MNHSKKHYVKYAAINYAKYMANYNDYLEILKQVNEND